MPEAHTNRPGRRAPGAPLRPWQRLSVRLAALFAMVTLVAVALVGSHVYRQQRRDVEGTVGAQLLNIARTAALLLDPAAHARLAAAADDQSPAYRRMRADLAAVQRELVLANPVYTLTDYDPASRRVRLVVSSDPDERPGLIYTVAAEVAEPLGWTFNDAVARFTPLYRDARGTWITAFSPVGGEQTGQAATAVLVVDYPVQIYLDRLGDMRTAVIEASLLGALGALLLGLLVARRITRPIVALTAGVDRVTGGDLSQELSVRSRDEVGHLTRAFNGMLAGLRQRDFIRSAFGRYVSPEVARTLLESPGGLRLGGEKRVVTILMCDLRGYTRFAEQGDPAWVMEVLNAYLARMTDVLIEYGGTVNEFIGDAIFAIFGAPLPQPDHAERAAAAALAMQRAMTEINAGNAARGLPRFDMGIGVNTGEAVVGNIGSEQRAKYTVVGSAVNAAARVESATVGGQIFVSAATYAAIRALADVAPPVSVEVKGLAEPLVLYELRGLEGRFAIRLPAAAVASEAAVALAVQCAVVDGKVVRAETVEGTSVSVGPRQVAVRLGTALPPLTNVRLRLRYPDGAESADLYGKVVGETDGVTRIHLTALAPADEKTLEALVGRSARPAGKT